MLELQLFYMLLILVFVLPSSTDAGFLSSISTSAHRPLCSAIDASTSNTVANDSSAKNEQMQSSIFTTFSEFLTEAQSDIISKIENHPCNPAGVCFSSDPWENEITSSRGLTRVIQPLDDEDCFIEKGAVSTTFLVDGILSAERAKAIQGRRGSSSSSVDDNFVPKEGDIYQAAALSLVLHTRSPMVPTFRSDVRIFMVQSKKTGQSVAWFGGGADLTPYYLFDEDVSDFHERYKNLCNHHFEDDGRTYDEMKAMCDEYFFIPARKEHRGTGGIFFDDMDATPQTQEFVQDVAKAWMPSWLGIVKKRNSLSFTEQQRKWQLLRRGRYLEFNLLYDRGVRFGLVSPNPRIEGIMVSAPPLIAWEYNHEISEGSEEDRLMQILKSPKKWA